MGVKLGVFPYVQLGKGTWHDDERFQRPRFCVAVTSIFSSRRVKPRSINAKGDIHSQDIKRDSSITPISPESENTHLKKNRSRPPTTVPLTLAWQMLSALLILTSGGVAAATGVAVVDAELAQD